MSELRESVEAEMENIQRVVAEFPPDDLLDGLTSLELAGVAALIHNFYNGVENVLKQIVLWRGENAPVGASWHRDLVNAAVSKGVVSAATAAELRRYLGFRHFFSHAYSFDIDYERVRPLVVDICRVLAAFKDDIDRALK